MGGVAGILLMPNRMDGDGEREIVFLQERAVGYSARWLSMT